MAKFQCKCGAILSNSRALNDVELIVYTDIEWDDVINSGDLIDPVTIQSPRYDVWRCNECERIYVFEENVVIKTYAVEGDT